MTEMPENTTALPPTPPPQVLHPKRAAKPTIIKIQSVTVWFLPSAKNCWQNSWALQPE